MEKITTSFSWIILDIRSMSEEALAWNAFRLTEPLKRVVILLGVVDKSAGGERLNSRDKELTERTCSNLETKKPFLEIND